MHDRRDSGVTLSTPVSQALERAVVHLPPAWSSTCTDLTLEGGEAVDPESLDSLLAQGDDLVVVDVEPSEASGALAARYDPERNRVVLEPPRRAPADTAPDQLVSLL